MNPKPEDWPTNERIDNIGLNGHVGDALSLNAYFSNLDAIEALKQENELIKAQAETELRKLKRQSKAEVKLIKKNAQVEINALQKRLATEMKLKSKWRCKYEKIKPKRKSIRTKKNQQAIDLIAARENGDKTHTLVEIGKLLGISYGTIKNMAYTYRQTIKQSD